MAMRIKREPAIEKQIERKMGGGYKPECDTGQFTHQGTLAFVRYKLCKHG